MGELGRAGGPPEQWQSQGWKPPRWLQRLVYAKQEVAAMRDAREKAPGRPATARLAAHVPAYPAEPVVRPKRHRRNLKGRFR